MHVQEQITENPVPYLGRCVCSATHFTHSIVSKMPVVTPPCHVGFGLREDSEGGRTEPSM